jgi:hypothetical protein
MTKFNVFRKDNIMLFFSYLNNVSLLNIKIIHILNILIYLNKVIS